MFGLDYVLYWRIYKTTHIISNLEIFYAFWICKVDIAKKQIKKFEWFQSKTRFAESILMKNSKFFIVDGSLK